VGQDLVDDAHPVEADHDRQPARDGRGLVAADLLQPTNVSFDLDPAHVQRVKILTCTPDHAALVGIGIRPPEQPRQPEGITADQGCKDGKEREDHRQYAEGVKQG
jgi:hypothetical protein